MSPRSARAIRAGIAWGKDSARLALALGQSATALLEGDVPGFADRSLTARGYRRGVRTVINGRHPRRYRRTWQPVAA